MTKKEFFKFLDTLDISKHIAIKYYDDVNNINDNHKTAKYCLSLFCDGKEHFIKYGRTSKYHEDLKRDLFVKYIRWLNEYRKQYES